MNVLFWNINRKNTTDKMKIEDYIIRCIEENHVDIAVFAEYKEKDTPNTRGKDNIDRDAIENGLGNLFEWITGIEPDGAVTLLARKSLGEVDKIDQDLAYIKSIHQLTAIFWLRYILKIGVAIHSPTNEKLLLDV